MTAQKDIKGKIALIAGILLLLGALTFVIVKVVQAKKDKDEEPLDEPERATSSSSNSPSSGVGSSMIQKMQTVLLNMGIVYKNQEIIDAIMLTGGIDGVKGEGFDRALEVAIENSYLKSYAELQSQVS